MDEIENSTQKPKVCKLAVLSLLLAIFSLSFFIISFILALLISKFINNLLFDIIFSTLSFVSMVIGILAIYKIRKSQGRLKGIFIALLGIIIALLAILIPVLVKG